MNSALAQTSGLPQVGTLVAERYRLLEPLDRGGMGCVFRAEDTRLARPCALKFMRPELAAQPELRRRFEHEAHTAGQLRIENIISVTDYGEHADLPYLVMELLEGETLAALLRREPRLPLARARDLLAQAARGLHAVHEHGIVHRDLKPSNLFVTRHADGRDLVKVIDFGVARSVTAASYAGHTAPGALLGTIQYMPPEQIRGETIDARTDVYALGAVLYEVLAGETPYQGDAPHVLMHRILEQPLPPLHERRQGLPAGIYALVSRSLARDPSARPESAAALAERLEQGEDAANAAPRVRASVVMAAFGVALIATALGVWLVQAHGGGTRHGSAAATVPATHAPAAVAEPSPRAGPAPPTAPVDRAEPAAPPSAAVIEQKPPTRAASARKRESLDIGEVFRD